MRYFLLQHAYRFSFTRPAKVSPLNHTSSYPFDNPSMFDSAWPVLSHIERDSSRPAVTVPRSITGTPNGQGSPLRTIQAPHPRKKSVATSNERPGASAIQKQSSSGREIKRADRHSPRLSTLEYRRHSIHRHQSRDLRPARFNAVDAGISRGSHPSERSRLKKMDRAIHGTEDPRTEWPTY